MKFLISTGYRREVLLKRPSQRLYQSVKMIDFPSKDQIGQFKKAVDATELQLRGGSIISDYGAAVKSIKKVTQNAGQLWETGLTVAKSGNAFGEIAAGGHSLKKSMEEWSKGHYFCCVYS